jgi:hypothetical protein
LREGSDQLGGGEGSARRGTGGRLAMPAEKERYKLRQGRHGEIRGAGTGRSSSRACADRQVELRHAVAAYQSAGGRRELLTLLFFDMLIFQLADKWAPMSMSAGRLFFAMSALIGGSHQSDYMSIRNQFEFSPNCKKNLL